MRLMNGSQVVIIGGGPAGSFSALHLFDQAAAAGLELQVKILEPRDFTRPGSGGCNKCAGILSSGLVQNLEKIGLRLPPEVIQSELDTYILHADESELPIHIPNPNKKIISIYRGSGPRLGTRPLPASFDDWLLQQARQRGAEILKLRAQSIRPGNRPVVVTARGELEADLVILATGINNHILIDPAFGYQRPGTEVMAQDEVLLPGNLSENTVHIFFEYPASLIFGALIPKGRYANISLLGHRLPPDSIDLFLRYNFQKGVVPAGTAPLCGCAPQIAVSAAKGFFSDRFVAVGDAAVTRLYKDGIGSAFITAGAAARCAVQQGISGKDFAAGYLPACQKIARDNFFGRLLFWQWSFARRSRMFRKAWMKTLQKESGMPPASRIHTSILWGMFTGDETYQKMFWRSISLRFILVLLREMLPSGGTG